MMRGIDNMTYVPYLCPFLHYLFSGLSNKLYNKLMCWNKNSVKPSFPSLPTAIAKGPTPKSKIKDIIFDLTRCCSRFWNIYGKI